MNIADLRKHSVSTTRTFLSFPKLVLVAILIAGSTVVVAERSEALPVAEPEENGFSPARLKLLSEFLKAEVARMQTPGATLLIMRNGRIVVLGRLIEVVSGKKLSAYFQEEIFEPLGMHDTGFYIPKSQLHRAAQGYDPKTEDYPASLLDITKPPVFESGGGGLVSSMYDYARFCQLILNGGELDGVRLVGRKTVELMSADHLSQEVAPGDLYLPGPGQGFGLGFAVRRSVGVTGFLGSKGEIRWGGMAGTAFWIDPEEKLICIWMIQDVPQSSHYRQRFKNLVYQAIVD